MRYRFTMRSSSSSTDGRAATSRSAAPTAPPWDRASRSGEGPDAARGRDADLRVGLHPRRRRRRRQLQRRAQSQALLAVRAETRTGATARASVGRAVTCGEAATRRARRLCRPTSLAAPRRGRSGCPPLFRAFGHALVNDFPVQLTNGISTPSSAHHGHRERRAPRAEPRRRSRAPHEAQGDPPAQPATMGASEPDPFEQRGSPNLTLLRARL